jgi:hypothetical protein
MLDSQIAKVTRKAKTIQHGLYCLLSAALAFLACALFEATRGLHDSFVTAAVILHVLGLALFMAGILWAMRELTLSLSPLAEEDAYLETITTNRLAQLPGGRNLRIARSA